ncbi:YafY family protein [Oerskovia sp. KBS0722]|uniref:helix-turn-helix transcriptional regulator n=1 Tax=Oerskovia sp. KBS0722 TaxID=1179673 RepID=UPI00110DCFF2|nr:WYL domain-containing protein [Oerskovia sp. KBS0722]QDW61440.1 WYL domain-containing protein [Oerskovia sp. KBS0722]
MNKTERLYAVAEELRRAGPGGTTGPRLARLLEVSERTIKRDVSALQQAGLPVRAQAGPGGGYVLDPSASLPPVNFTPQQAVAVAVALAALPPGSPFAVDAATAQGKVWDALGPQARERAVALAARVWIDHGAASGRAPDGASPLPDGGARPDLDVASGPVGSVDDVTAPDAGPDGAASGNAVSDDAARGTVEGVPGDPVPRARVHLQVLRAVEQSLARSVVLAIRYRDGRGHESARRVEPVILAHTADAWYLIAWCRSREAVRWFRLDRVERADLTGEPYVPRPVAEVGTPPSGAMPVA